MLSRSYRFHGHNSLSYAYKNGRTVRSDLLSLRVAPNERRQRLRCAVVVSKKITKSAVKRNRIRRRLYELVRARTAAIETSVDLIITVFKEDIATMEASELTIELDNLLIKAGLLSKA